MGSEGGAAGSHRWTVSKNIFPVKVFRVGRAGAGLAGGALLAGSPRAGHAPGATTIAPALSNAIFAATGGRVRQVPLQPDRVLRAIQQKA